MALEAASMYYLFQNRSYQTRASISWTHNPIHDVESIWWISLWILYNIPGATLSKDDLRLRTKLFKAAEPIERTKAFSGKGIGNIQPKKCPIPAKHLEDWRLALIHFYEEQQLDLNNGSHESFDYDKVLIDAIARVEMIQQALVDSRRNDSPMVPPVLDEAHAVEGPEDSAT